MPNRAAANQKAYRDRLKDGRRVFKLELDEAMVIDALLAARVLRPEDADDHEAVEAALARSVTLAFSRYR